ncbi:unnamed protein product [Aureobasidium uvarum]|uniref:Uncharacterized protein n=1 Tax=Aureobasidium uvarum TaxID=2773716 RepID=A0A9N8PRS1_9PEZI|nr:unnamed protein product [Aureobasidium uvarum]
MVSSQGRHGQWSRPSKASLGKAMARSGVQALAFLETNTASVLTLNLTYIMPCHIYSPSMVLVLSRTSSTSYPNGVLQAANGDTGKDPGYIVLNNGDTGKDPGARETEGESINTLLFAFCGDRLSPMA